MLHCNYIALLHPAAEAMHVHLGKCSGCCLGEHVVKDQEVRPVAKTRKRRYFVRCLHYVIDFVLFVRE